MARVLLVSLNFEPEPTGIAVNSTNIAYDLTKSGHHVDVLAGMPHYPEWRIQPGYRGRWRCREDSDEIAIHRVWHFVPRRHNALARGFYELTFFANAYSLRLQPQPDVVVGVIPALSAGRLARHFASRYSVPWGLVFADLVARAATQSGYPGGRLVSGLVMREEHSIARQADAVAVISDGFSSYLRTGGVPADRISRIVNRNVTRQHTSTQPISRAEMRLKLGWGDNEFVVLHTGNMGFKQALDSVIAAAELLRHTGTVRFVLAGDGNRRLSIERRIHDLRLANVDVRPLFDADEYQSALRAADVLLLHQGAQVTDMSLPGKLFNYLSSGVPVIVAAALDSEAGREARRASTAAVVTPERPGELADAILRVQELGNSADEHPLGEQSDDRWEEPCIERVSIDSFVDRLLGRTAGRYHTP
jgi:colanic acid biosynthesis glycosyl transferase WcaI